MRRLIALLAVLSVFLVGCGDGTRDYPHRTQITPDVSVFEFGDYRCVFVLDKLGASGGSADGLWCERITP